VSDASTNDLSHTSEDYRHHHCVSLKVLSGYPLDQMPGHTHGGLDTYHCVSVNVSSDYSVHQICYYIYIYHIFTDALEWRCVYV